jgi:predicted nucleotidyltransferase component of viral defense system
VSKDRPKNLPASVRQRLLNLAHDRKEELQLVLIRYGVERLLYRLSVSRHADQFVLKGAMLFQLWTGQLHRSTLDVDLLGSGSDDVARLVKVFQEVCSQKVEDDGLIFLPDSVRGEEIRENQQYGGVRIQMVGMLDKARIPVQIDIGFGDIITPRAKAVPYPSLVGFPTSRLPAYPKETVVAEKYQTMVSLGIANSRMKDFYDVWTLAQEFDFEGTLLAQAILATFKRRGTPLPQTVPLALTQEFSADKSKRIQWTAFVKRGRLMREAPPFDKVVDALTRFLWPITEAVARGDKFDTRWVAGGPWK